MAGQQQTTKPADELAAAQQATTEAVAAAAEANQRAQDLSNELEQLRADQANARTAVPAASATEGKKGSYVLKADHYDEIVSTSPMVTRPRRKGDKITLTKARAAELLAAGAIEGEDESGPEKGAQTEAPE